MKKLIFIIGIIFLGVISHLIQKTKLVLVDAEISEQYQWIGVVLEDPPLTRSGTMEWWEDNKTIVLGSLTHKIDTTKFWSVTIYALGDGFKMYDPREAETVSYCFNNLPTQLNCIKKDVLLLVRNRVKK